MCDESRADSLPDFLLPFLAAVAIASITRSSDTTGVSYVVTSLAGSTEKLGRFAVAVPGVAEWVGGMIPPGSSTPELHFDAVGLPGIVTYWAGGMFVFLSRDEENNNSPEPDPLATEMINGQTVGVDSWPADRTAKALIARLRRLTQRTCGVNRLAYWLLKINADIVVSVL